MIQCLVDSHKSFVLKRLLKYVGEDSQTDSKSLCFAVESDFFLYSDCTDCISRIDSSDVGYFGFTAKDFD